MENNKENPVSLTITGCKHSTNIGFQIVLRLTDQTGPKTKQSLDVLYLTGTNNATSNTCSGIKKEIEKQLKKLKISYTTEKAIFKSTTFFFEKENLEKITSLKNDIVSHFKKINEGDFKLSVQYGISDESYNNYAIIFKEKYGQRLFIVNTPNDAYKVFLKILTERNEQDWYSWMENYTPHNNDKRPAYSINDVKALPDTMTSIKENMIEELSEWAKYDQEAKEIKETYKNIQEAIETQNGNLAYSVLLEHRNGEYEKFDIIESEKF